MSAPKIPKGWRKLSPRSIIREGDKIRARINGRIAWAPVIEGSNAIGRMVGAWTVIRRTTAKPAAKAGNGSPTPAAMRAMRRFVKEVGINIGAVRDAYAMSVQIKPLVWAEQADYASALSLLGIRYDIAQLTRGGWRVYCPPEGRGDHPTLEAAKAACQADHEARVLAMLEPGPFAPGVSRAVLERLCEVAGRLAFRLDTEDECVCGMCEALAAARAELERPAQADARRIAELEERLSLLQSQYDCSVETVRLMAAAPQLVACADRMPTEADGDCEEMLWLRRRS